MRRIIMLERERRETATQEATQALVGKRRKPLRGALGLFLDCASFHSQGPSLLVVGIPTLYHFASQVSREESRRVGVVREMRGDHSTGFGWPYFGWSKLAIDQQETNIASYHPIE